MKVWSEIRIALAHGWGITQSERDVLVQLLDRMRKRPAARKALGFRQKSRVADRNGEIALACVRLQNNKRGWRSLAKCLPELRKEFPTIGASVIRQVCESSKWMAPARAKYLAENPRPLLNILNRFDFSHPKK